ESPSLADANEVQAIGSVFAQDVPHAAAQITFDIVAQSQRAIISVRVTPVDEINIQARSEQPAHERSIRLQIEHVGAIYQSEADEYRSDSGGSRDSLVPVQSNFVLAPHDLLVGAARGMSLLRRAPRIWRVVQPVRRT